MSTNLQAQAFLHRLSENTTAIQFCKWKTKIIKNVFFFGYNLFFNSGRALVNRAGRKPVRAGRSALINMPSWNTAVHCLIVAVCSELSEVLAAWRWPFIVSRVDVPPAPATAEHRDRLASLFTSLLQLQLPYPLLLFRSPIIIDHRLVHHILLFSFCFNLKYKISRNVTLSAI